VWYLIKVVTKLLYTWSMLHIDEVEHILMFNWEKFKFLIVHRNKYIWTVKLVLPLLTI
jgi:hypothetical protein